MKKIIKEVIQWTSAIAVAVVVFNGLLFLYNKPTAFIDRTNSSTNTIHTPGNYILHGTEGWGLHPVDRNGYVNKDLPLQEDYCVVVGASYTQGKEVKQGERFTDILNEKLADSNDALAIYNCSQDGYYFPSLTKNFYAITQEFSDAKAIVIEIGNTDFSTEQLIEGLEQRDFDEKQLGKNIYSSLSTKEKLSIKVKDFVPIYTIFKNQVKAFNKTDNADTVDNSKTDTAKQEKALGDLLAKIRGQWDKELIIMYHPAVEINNDGTMSTKKLTMVETFDKLCKENDITFVNVAEAFENQYNKDYSVPYGFSNTSMGSGHLNSVGHRIIADELYDILKGILKR